LVEWLSVRFALWDLGCCRAWGYLVGLGTKSQKRLVASRFPIPDSREPPRAGQCPGPTQGVWQWQWLHHGLPMVAAELDWMKAYDSVDRWVKEMALRRRLGLAYIYMTLLIISLNLIGEMSSEYEPTTGTVNPLRVGVRLARRVVLRAAMYSLLSWTGCLRWLSAAVMDLQCTK
jgi:hypothetical protein